MQENSSRIPRRWERQPAAIPISLGLEADPFKADDSAITIDVSRRGVGVLTTLALFPGERVRIVANGEFPHAIPARVVWVREDEDESSHWSFAGIEFF